MKKFKHFVIGGIEQKIISLVFISIAMVILTYTVVLLVQANRLTKIVAETNEKQKTVIAGVTDSTLELMVTDRLESEAKKEATIANDLFTQVESQVRIVADYATTLYANPDQFERIDIKEPDASTKGTTSAQLIYSDDTDITDPAIIDEIGLLGNLGGLMVAQYDNSVVNSMFITSANDITIITDNTPQNKYNPDGSLKKLRGTQRPWYKATAEEGDIYYSNIETDSFTGGVEITITMPVYKDGELVAVAGADLYLETMKEEVEGSNQEGGFLMIVNQNGQVIFSPKKSGIFEVQDSSKAQDLRECDNEELAEFIAAAIGGVGSVREVEVEGVTYYMAGSALETVGWAVITSANKEVVLSPSSQMMNQYEKNQTEAITSYRDSTKRAGTIIAVVLGLGVLLALFCGQMLAKQIVKPLNEMANDVTNIKNENNVFEMKKIYNTGDEVQALAEAFEDLTKRSREYIGQILKITAEKERIGAELNVATQIQADMLPTIFPPFPDRKDVDLYASMDPAREVGGDFYDFFLVDENHLAMVMADVSGKGVPAALFMVIAKTLIKNRAMMGGSPAEILTEVNNQLCEGNEAEMFVTVWLAIVDLRTGKGLAANAGHEHPVICHKGGQFELVVYKHALALATMEGVKYKEHEFTLLPGDKVFVYTDGVPEATDKRNELFGTGRMLEALNEDPSAEPSELISNVRVAIDEFVEDEEQFDDITMLCIVYHGKEENE